MLTGEPDAGDPHVRFGGRGGAIQCVVPTPILNGETSSILNRVDYFPPGSARGPEHVEGLRGFQHEPRGIPSAKWRELIENVWEADPLLCPKCSREMRIVALIEWRRRTAEPSRQERSAAQR